MSTITFFKTYAVYTRSDFRGLMFVYYSIEISLKSEQTCSRLIILLKSLFGRVAAVAINSHYFQDGHTNNTNVVHIYFFVLKVPLYHCNYAPLL